MGVELMDSSVIWYAVLAVVVVALVFVLFNFNKVTQMNVFANPCFGPQMTVGTDIRVVHHFGRFN